MTKAEKDIYNFTKRHMKENNISRLALQYFTILVVHFQKPKWKMY